MKRLEELGISPAPWGFGRPSKTHDAWIYCDDRLRGGAKKCNMFFVHYPYVGMMDERRVRREQTANARLIAAAPKLYEYLREAVIEMCHDCLECGPAPHYDCADSTRCFVQKCRAALAAAAGEEVDDGREG